MASVLNLWKKTSALPLVGDRVFSIAFARRRRTSPPSDRGSPWSSPTTSSWSSRKRRGVHNHIGTVHAIALCNGLEAAMGALAESTIPRDRRWIPKGMEVAYTAKATTDITCIAETDPGQWTAESARATTCRCACAAYAPTAPSWSRARSGSG